MYGIALLHGMVFYGPISALYRQAHGLTISQITVMEGISLALCIFLEVPWGMGSSAFISNWALYGQVNDT